MEKIVKVGSLLGKTALFATPPVVLSYLLNAYEKTSFMQIYGFELTQGMALGCMLGFTLDVVLANFVFSDLEEHYYED